MTTPTATTTRFSKLIKSLEDDDFHDMGLALGKCFRYLGLRNNSAADSVAPDSVILEAAIRYNGWLEDVPAASGAMSHEQSSPGLGSTKFTLRPELDGFVASGAAALLTGYRQRRAAPISGDENA